MVVREQANCFLRRDVQFSKRSDIYCVTAFVLWRIYKLRRGFGLQKLCGSFLSQC